MSKDKTSIELNSANRRKFISTTSKVLPLAAMVSSKSVWAQCMSLSGALSGNLSGNRTYECGGTKAQTPGFWKNHPECWPPNAFAGCAIFEGGSKTCIWDWSRGVNVNFNPNSTKECFAWKASHNGGDPHPTSWGYMGFNYGFLTKETIWESLDANQVSEIEYHFAACVLNASHPSVDFGYNILQLKQYCDQITEDKWSRFGQVLASLNEREHVDAPELDLSEGRMVKIRYQSDRNSNKNKTFSTYSLSGTSDSNKDSANDYVNDLSEALKLTDDTYPEFFHSA